MKDILSAALDWLRASMTLSNLGPYGAGSPVALVLAVSFYRVLVMQLPGFETLALFAAIVSTLTVIAIEGYGYKQVARALAESNITAAILSAVAAVVCSALVLIGVWQASGLNVLGASIGFQIMLYILLAIGQYMARTNQVQAQVVAVNQSSAETALKLEQERTKQARAAAQIAKAGASAGVQSVQSVSSVSSGQMDGYHFDAEIMAKIRAYLAEHPGASVREVGAAGLGVRKSAAAAYMAEIERKG